MRQVKRGDAHGLFECYGAAMKFVGVDDWEEKLIGLGCDGTNVNIAAGRHQKTTIQGTASSRYPLRPWTLD